MGNASSNAGDLSDDNNNNNNLDPFDGIDTLGYRILGVQPNSPASQAGLVSFLDFMVGANDQMLLGSGEHLQEGEEYDDINLPELLEENKNKELELLVWNIKSQQTRLVTLIPADNWGGAGLLGVTIRLDNYAAAEDRLIRVLTVEPHSPAQVAGLVPEKDFLLGTTHQTLENTHTLGQILQDHRDTVVEFYVYNTDSDLVRTVALMPTTSWGGRGLLGAEVGVGYLHRLPHTTRSTEGASVARKVKYVGIHPSHDKPNASNTILELEPQLEMEASEHSDAESASQEVVVETVVDDDEDDADDVATARVAGSGGAAHDLTSRREKPAASAPLRPVASPLPDPPMRRPSATTTASEATERTKSQSYPSAEFATPLPPPPKMRTNAPNY